MPTISERSQFLKQSGIRNASQQCAKIGGINLGQGICDIPMLDMIQDEAYSAMKQGKNIYSACQGVHELRNYVAEKIQRFNGIAVNPETEVLITHGATGAFICAIMSVFNPGDEIILFEPFYGYHKNILELYELQVKTVPININDLSIDINDVKKAIGPRTKGIIICTPNNPTGKVFSKEELIAIGRLATEHDLTIITDEIYEYITYPGYEHYSIASLEDFKQRTLTISGFSKTFNMTGWRLGYVSGDATLIDKMSLVQDLLYVCPATPLQHAAIVGLKVNDSYYKGLRDQFLVKRDRIVGQLRELGFKLAMPEGAYYLLADISVLGTTNSEIAAETLLQKAKVAVVPGSSFYLDPKAGAPIVRICFALQEAVLEQAVAQIRAIL